MHDGGDGDDELRAIDEIGRSFHGVINCAAVIVGGAETLRASWREMTDAQRDMVLDMVQEQSEAIQEILGELTRRPPSELHAAIEHHAHADENIAAARRAAEQL
jgi:hypothetical protein